MAIQMPPLNTTLVEVHQELANHTRTAKHMATAYTNMEKAIELLQQQWSATRKENDTPATWLQQIEALLKASQERLPAEGVLGDLQLPNKELYEQLRVREWEFATLTERAEWPKAILKICKNAVKWPTHM